MKKSLFFLISALFLIFLAACNDNSQEDNNAEASDEESNESSESETKTFTTDSGDEVEVPADPERIVVLHPTYIGALLKFGHEPVGVSFYVDQDEVLNEATEGIERIDPEDVESIINLEPDLIVATATDPNLNKLQQIAPTVTFDSMISTYKDNTKLLGELVGEEDQAQAWLDEWEEKMSQDAEEYKDLIGNSTLSIFQSTPKGLVSFNTDYGRGGEILYDGYGFVQPEALAEVTRDQFNVELSTEELPEYAGDFIVLATEGEEAPIVESAVWKNAEAVQNNRVIELDLAVTRYNDPISLEAQRDIIKEQLDAMK
ncbi:ABC transporter substrate-binding protein [Oceanobacillus neutriphilus]|uniref:Ferrichrome ABC transporter substrate-binding protein n=1 Tax=Oceanobacillus neutriphilus TaxID=531815 RepID=A0ABQ2NQZ2_9BACI|nr:ABC transporter substrate-binding protein [Oceanobacillus neutriphilus]GGP08303.1 ferrichrome ABC transporter substrate-binding protein [Oceanobacillus neutriphilus]